MERQFSAGGTPLSYLFPDLYSRVRLVLVEARKSAGVTQVELAEKLKRPQSFVAKFEVGERRLYVAEFVVIAGLLGADPFGLLQRAEAEGDHLKP